MYTNTILQPCIFLFWLNSNQLYSKMPPYFELKLELYSYLLTEPSTSAHAKLVKSISKAVGKTFNKPLRDQENQVSRY